MEQRTLGIGLLPSALTPGRAGPGLAWMELLLPSPSCFCFLPDAGSVPLHPSCPCHGPSSPPLAPDHLGLFICLSHFCLFFFLFLSKQGGLSPSDLAALLASPFPSLPLTYALPSLSLSLSISLGVCLLHFGSFVHSFPFSLTFSLIYSYSLLSFPAHSSALTPSPATLLPRMNRSPW